MHYCIADHKALLVKLPLPVNLEKLEQHGEWTLKEAKSSQEPALETARGRSISARISVNYGWAIASYIYKYYYTWYWKLLAI